MFEMTNEEICDAINSIQRGVNLIPLMLKRDPVICGQCSVHTGCEECSKPVMLEAKIRKDRVVLVCPQCQKIEEVPDDLMRNAKITKASINHWQDYVEKTRKRDGLRFKAIVDSIAGLGKNPKKKTADVTM